VNDLAAIVEDAIVEALERGVIFRRPLRVDLDWQELARLHGPFGSHASACSSATATRPVGVRDPIRGRCAPGACG
jgi:DNA-binding transcriptional regulator YdaS (Cro superfamily)